MLLTWQDIDHLCDSASMPDVQCKSDLICMFFKYMKTYKLFDKRAGVWYMILNHSEYEDRNMSTPHFDGILSTVGIFLSFIYCDSISCTTLPQNYC